MQANALQNILHSVNPQPIIPKWWTQNVVSEPEQYLSIGEI